jgi:hypothetical protein
MARRSAETGPVQNVTIQAGAPRASVRGGIVVEGHLSSGFSLQPYSRTLPDFPKTNAARDALTTG